MQRAAFLMEAFVSGFSTKSEMCLNLPAPPTESYDVRAVEQASTITHLSSGLGPPVPLRKSSFRSHASYIFMLAVLKTRNVILATGLPVFLLFLALPSLHLGLLISQQLISLEVPSF